MGNASEINGCVVVPAYREAGRIGTVVRQILAAIPHCVVIDDGSPDKTADEAQAAGAVVIRHERNRGKGMALNTGFAYAREQGYEVVITMDGDGQHSPEDLPRFLEAYKRTGIPVLIGNRMAHTEDMPFIRRLTNRYMSWLLSRQMHQFIPDTQCGFRLFRCDVIPILAPRAERFAAESEILLSLADRGVRMDSVPVATIYRDERSKINPFIDTFRFYHMLWRHRREQLRSGQRRGFDD